MIKGGNLPQIEEEVEKTKELLKKYLNVECIGLRGPWGYYRGLSDRPDILEILYNLGIRLPVLMLEMKRIFSLLILRYSPFAIAPEGLVVYWKSRFKLGKMFT